MSYCQRGGVGNTDSQGSPMGYRETAVTDETMAVGGQQTGRRGCGAGEDGGDNQNSHRALLL